MSTQDEALGAVLDLLDLPEPTEDDLAARVTRLEAYVYALRHMAAMLLVGLNDPEHEICHLLEGGQS